MAVKVMFCFLCTLLTIAIFLFLWEIQKLFESELYATEYNAEFKIKDNQNISLLKKYFMNLINFQFIINANCCNPLTYCKVNSNSSISKAKIKILWIITSYAGDVSKRNVLRQAYTDKELLQLGIRRVFLLGMISENANKLSGMSQLKIENEAQKFQDIVQGNFIEAYKNLTVKHLMGIQWAVRCGKSYSYIMKMDDDIVVNIYEILNLIKNQSIEYNNELLMGYVMNHMTPIRNITSKWYVKYEEFSEKYYPPFLSGWFYVIDTTSALKLIIHSYKISNYFWIDDVFVTGILRKISGINKFINISQYFTTDYRFLNCCLSPHHDSLKFKCDFFVGPDGDDSDILIRFTEHSKYCYSKKNCSSRSKNMLLKDTCILNYQNLNIVANGSSLIVKLL